MKDYSVSIHHRNIRLLAIKLYKAKNSLCSQLIIELFWEVNYNLRKQTNIFLKSINTSGYGLKSLRYLASKIWNLVPQGLQKAFPISVGRLSLGYLMVVLVFYVAQILTK